MFTLRDLPINPYVLHFLEVWLRSRTCSVRLAAPFGRFSTGSKPITRWLPLGGILSPFLWLPHLNGLRAAVAEEVATWTRDLGDIRVLDKYCADYVAFALAHCDSEVPVAAGARIAFDLRVELGLLGLYPGVPKCYKMAVSPVGTSGYVYR